MLQFDVVVVVQHLIAVSERYRTESNYQELRTRA